jgi:hypothetical protein
MNLKQLKKQVGMNLRLRPLPLRIDASGEQLPDCDDHWCLQNILEEPSSLQLLNISTGHILNLQPDNVKEYRSPDFLLLRCRVIIGPQGIAIEPIYDNNDVFVRLEHQMPALLSEMRADLNECPLRREMVVLKRSFGYESGSGNELRYFIDDHPDLLSQLQILANHQLVKDITYNNVTRYVMSEDLARYLGA